jgi:hypothetical protein
MSNPVAVPGTNVPSGAAVSPGGAQGVQGLTGPIVVSTDTGNIATIGTDNQILVPQSAIWNVRLRSYNAIGNPNFEVDQRNVGNTVTVGGSSIFSIDRWTTSSAGTMRGSMGQSGPATGLVPGTNFRISSKQLGVSVTTQETSLAAGDYFSFLQVVEGSAARELISDVTSISLLAYSSIANLKFSVAIGDPTGSRSLVKLCSMGAAGTWTLFTLPNIPLFPAAGTFSMLPGVAGYNFFVTLACGTTLTAPAADVWQNGNFVGAPGMSNFFANAVNSTFYLGFVQHEPGPVCTTLQDKPFSQNYDECLRYYAKSYDYGIKGGTVSTANQRYALSPNGAVANPNLTTPSALFPKPMAQLPSVQIWSPATGVANAVYDPGASLDRGVNAINGLGTIGFGQVTLGTSLTAGWWGLYHYIADTGW